MALIYNATFDSQTRVLSLLDKAGNVISSCEVPSKELVDDIMKPLTFRATQDGSTVKLIEDGPIYSTFETSRDGGNTWTYYDLGTVITLNTGDEVSFRVSAYQKPGYNKSHHFKMTGKIEAWHNVMSMKTDRLGDTQGWFDPMADYEFASMFSSCTSLTKAPALPATTLANDCYSSMFAGCQSLTKAPELPATVLAQSCYSRMFERCQSLKEVRVSATTTATDALYNWLSGVSATGDFYCNPNATIFPSGVSGIPANWNRHALSDYPVTP